MREEEGGGERKKEGGGRKNSTLVRKCDQFTVNDINSDCRWRMLSATEKEKASTWNSNWPWQTSQKKTPPVDSESIRITNYKECNFPGKSKQSGNQSVCWQEPSVHKINQSHTHTYTRAQSNLKCSIHGRKRDCWWLFKAPFITIETTQVVQEGSDVEALPDCWNSIAVEAWRSPESIQKRALSSLGDGIGSDRDWSARTYNAHVCS